MALIICKECEVQVSDQAIACPSCGFPVAKSERERTQTEKAQKLEQQQIEDHEKLQKFVLRNLNKSNSPFSLRTVNGAGFRMYGFYPLITHEGKTLGLSVHGFCFFFIPLIPCGLYLIDHLGTSYKFYGSVPLIESLNVLGLKGSIRLAYSIGKDVLIMFVTLVVIILVAALLIYAFD